MNDPYNEIENGIIQDIPTTEGRATLCARLLKILAEEVGYTDDYPGSPGRVVRAAVLDYLTRTGTLSLTCTVRWHEGCSCHGSSEQESLEETTLEGMGQALVRHGHADGSDIDEARWSLRLSDEEEDTLRAAYNLEVTRAASIKRAQWVLEKAQTDLDLASSVVTRLRSSLKSIRDELTETAITTREDEIRRAQEAVEALRLVVGEARMALENLKGTQAR